MNVVGAHSVITETIDCANHVFVTGRFEETLSTKGTLYVYPVGLVKGRVKAKDLMGAGRILGEIEVSNRLRAKNSASFEASINTCFLDWEKGAKLVGEVYPSF